MKRRRFLLTSGSAILGSTAIGSISQKPVFALEFDLSPVPNRKPSNIDSLLLQFSNFKLTPKYVDFSKDVTIETTVSIDNQTNTTTDVVSIADKNSISKDDITSEIVLDNVDTTKQSIDGSVDIVVKHDSIGEKSYEQTFTITNNPLINGLIAYYPMEKGSGEIIHDGAGNNIGQIKGPSWNGNGKVGSKALSFDGTKDGVNISDSSIQDTENSFTVTAWAKSDTIDGGIIEDNKSTNNRWSLSFMDDGSGSNSHISFRVFKNGTQYTISSDTDVTVFNHIVGVWDGSSNTISLFINGVEQTDDGVTGRISDTFGVTIGSNNDGNWRLDGEIDDVRIYNRILSQSEIDDLYNLTETSGRLVEESDVPNNNNSGFARYEFNGDVTDSWGNNDGTDKTSAGSKGIIDGFDDGNTNKWTGLNEGQISAQTSIVKEGSHAAELYSSSGTTFTAESYSGLPRYPRRGDTFEFWYRGEQGGDYPRTSMGWAADSNTGNRYRLRIEPNADSWTLFGADTTVLQSASPNLSLDTWYRIQIEFKDVITATLYDSSGSQISQLTGSDNYNRDRGGLVINQEVIGGSDSYGYIDEIKITNSSPINGVYGQSKLFDGVDDYVDTGIQSLEVPFTISAWVKSNMNDGTLQPVFRNYNATSDDMFFDVDFRQSEQRFRFSFDSVGDELIYNGVKPNNWYHIVGTIDQDDIRLYVNGKLEDSGNGGSATIDNGNNFWIGGDHNDRYLTGKVDDLRIYDKALTESEVQKLHKLGSWNIN